MKRSLSLTYFSHFEGDAKEFANFFGSSPDLRIECSCGAIMELRGDKATHSKLARDWKANHSGPGHVQTTIT